MMGPTPARRKRLPPPPSRTLSAATGNSQADPRGRPRHWLASQVCFFVERVCEVFVERDTAACVRSRVSSYVPDLCRAPGGTAATKRTRAASVALGEEAAKALQPTQNGALESNGRPKPFAVRKTQQALGGQKSGVAAGRLPFKDGTHAVAMHEARSARHVVHDRGSRDSFPPPQARTRPLKCGSTARNCSTD